MHFPDWKGVIRFPELLTWPLQGEENLCLLQLGAQKERLASLHVPRSGSAREEPGCRA